MSRIMNGNTFRHHPGIARSFGTREERVSGRVEGGEGGGGDGGRCLSVIENGSNARGRQSGARGSSKGRRAGN